MDRGAWQAMVHGVVEESDMTERALARARAHTHTHTHTHTNCTSEGKPDLVTSKYATVVF